MKIDGQLQLESKPGVITVRIISGREVAEAEFPTAEYATAFCEAMFLAIGKAWPETYRLRREAAQ